MILTCGAFIGEAAICPVALLRVSVLGPKTGTLLDILHQDLKKKKLKLI